LSNVTFKSACIYTPPYVIDAGNKLLTDLSGMAKDRNQKKKKRTRLLSYMGILRSWAEIHAYRNKYHDCHNDIDDTIIVHTNSYRTKIRTPGKNGMLLESLGSEIKDLPDDNDNFLSVMEDFAEELISYAFHQALCNTR